MTLLSKPLQANPTKPTVGWLLQPAKIETMASGWIRATLRCVTSKYGEPLEMLTAVAMLHPQQKDIIRNYESLEKLSKVGMMYEKTANENRIVSCHHSVEISVRCIHGT